MSDSDVWHLYEFFKALIPLLLGKKLEKVRREPIKHGMWDVAIIFPV